VFAILFPGLEFFEDRVEPLEPSFPKFAIAFEPAGGLCERLTLDAARAALGVNATGDEAGAFEDAKMLGNGGLGHVEGLGEFVDGSFAKGSEASEDGASGGVGEGGEGGVEALGSGHCITLRFHNLMVIYDSAPILVKKNLQAWEG
jgi:hypothetical protein